MQLRHELKHEISTADMLILRQRLGAIMQRDTHAVNGVYSIRSLYFDSPSDKALREKLNGVNNREKFRIRYYNGDLSFIRLEKKCKRNGLGWKEEAALSLEDARNIAAGKWESVDCKSEPLLDELRRRCVYEALRPRTIVDYTREPFYYPAGNVRVTLDYGLRTGLGGLDFLNPDCVTIPAQAADCILEIKWDEFLPDIIRDAVNIDGRRTSSFSKYAACRIYD